MWDRPASHLSDHSTSCRKSVRRVTVLSSKVKISCKHPGQACLLSMLIDLSDFGVVLRIFDMEMPREVELPRTRELVEVFDYSSDDSWTIYHNNVSNL